MQTTTASEASSNLSQGAPKEAYELRFWSLFKQGRAVSFPCDADGHVDLDQMSERGRNSYFYARAVIGREYAYPQVMPTRH